MAAKQQLEQKTQTTTRSARRGAEPRGDRTAVRIAEDVSNRIGTGRYKKWFSQARFSVDGGNLHVQTESAVVKRFIDSHFGKELAESAQLELGSEAQVAVELKPTSSASEDADMSGTKNTTKRAASRGGRRTSDQTERTSSRATTTTTRTKRGDRFETESRDVAVKAPRRKSTSSRPTIDLRNLDDLVVGACNELAMAGARRLAEHDDVDAVSPLFVWSACGLGKTHLLQGICQRFIERTGRAHRVRYMTGEQFTNEYIASVKAGTIEAFRERMRKLELLAIDDVRFLANKIRTQSELLYTLDELDMKGARVALSSDLHPRQIRGLRQPLVSRFLSGMVVQLDRPDRETRIALTRHLAMRRGLTLNDAALTAVAAQCLASVREMEGALTNLQALRDLTNTSGEVGLMLVQQVFDEESWQPNNPVRIATVIDAVCAHLGVSRAELIGSRRNRQVVTARGLVAYLGREMTSHSYPEIAQEMGRKYHSTVHTAAQRLKRQLRDDDTVQLGRGDPPMRMQELVDQVRHSIMRGGPIHGVKRPAPRSTDRVHFDQ